MNDKDISQEIDEELRFHIDMRIAENIASGMSSAEARAEAFSRFGNIEAIRQTCISIDRGTHFRSALWLLRILGVGGVALWASGIGPSLTVLGEMFAIIALLASVLIYQRLKTPQPVGFCAKDAQNDRFPENASFEADEVSGQTRKTLGIFAITLCLVLCILAASLAIVEFSSRFYLSR